MLGPFRPLESTQVGMWCPNSGKEIVFPVLVYWCFPKANILERQEAPRKVLVVHKQLAEERNNDFCVLRTLSEIMSE